MAIKKVYIGSIGPFLYDDADLVDDPDGDFPGETQRAVLTDGTILKDPSGITGAFNIITDIQAGGAGGVGFQYKERTLTFTSGELTTLGAESGWNDV